MGRFVLFIFLTIGQLAWSQTGKIIGTVQDAKSQTALAGANVVLKETQTGTTSNENGEFILESVPIGEYTLLVTYIGYAAYQITITVQEDQTTRVTILLQPTPIPTREVVVVATRARNRETPVVFTNLSQNYIREVHSVEDIPMMLTEIPNVFAYSDAGNGTGYSYLKVRGFDQKRIGVMINGIPLNDPEDHQVYWVDMPDFAESLQDIQLQRGVGSSLYGVSTFGGSLNLLTTPFSNVPGTEVFLNYGSYQTRKFGAKYNSGLLNNTWNIYVRLSRLLSDGYRDNSATEQWAYFAALSRVRENSITLLNVYGGKEITHAAWEASAESELKKNHRHNPITYSNAIDNFSQPHFELHHTHYFSDATYWKNSLFYIRGKGYYESLKKGRDLWEYGLWPNPDELESNLIRQKWVTKNQYGWISQLGIKHTRGELTLGTYLSLYNSDHWGEVEKLLSDVPLPSFQPEFKYYQYFGDKYYLTAFANELYRLTPRLNMMVNLHFQHIHYRFEHGKAGNFSGQYRHTFEVNYDFFNPRLGLNYNLNRNLNLFGNISLAQREPADDELYDLWDGPDDLGVEPLFQRSEPIFRNGRIEKIKWWDPVVKPEKLMDYELGIGYLTPSTQFKLNLFWMNFENEIVPFGTVDEDGFPIRGNARRTVHRGVEVSLHRELSSALEFSGNLSFNDNYFKSFQQFDYDWNTGQTSTTDLSGNQIALFPNILGNARLTYRKANWSTTLHVQRVGKQYLDNTQDAAKTIPAYTVVNARFIYRLNKVFRTSDLELNLQLNNILNEKYFTAGYYDAWAGENFYYPAAEGNLIAGVRFNL